MKVDILKQSGFCGGVTHALWILDKTIKENPGETIYLLGPIVHNMLVNNEYRDKGVVFVDPLSIEKVPDNAIVVISAHGKSDKEIQKLSRFRVVDTTCPYVQKNKQLIKSHEASNIIFIGKKAHAETRALCGDNDSIYIVENEDDINKFHSNAFGVVFNQTTYNLSKLEKIWDIIKKDIPNFEIINTICPVSKALQDYLRYKDEEYNVAVVVGDRTSSNANSLYEMSPYHPTYFVGSADEAKNLPIRQIDRIIIIGSASTPKKELQKVKDAIKSKELH